MRRPDARSAQIGGPDGISHAFQVKAYRGEPIPSSARRNLFPVASCRATLADELSKDGPEVSIVCGAEPFPGRAERLAGAATSPDGAIVGPARKPERETPSADPGEEVALIVGNKVICSNIGDAPFVNVARSDQAARDQASEPCRGERIDLIVIGGHAAPHTHLVTTLRTLCSYQPKIPE